MSHEELYKLAVQIYENLEKLLPAQKNMVLALVGTMISCGDAGK